MKEDTAFRFDQKKNAILQNERGVCFDDVIYAIETGNILDITEHHNKEKFAHQRCMVVNIDGYACLVPYIENEEGIFLKTIYPSRKATKRYLKTEIN